MYALSGYSFNISDSLWALPVKSISSTISIYATVRICELLRVRIEKKLLRYEQNNLLMISFGLLITQHKDISSYIDKIAVDSIGVRHFGCVFLNQLIFLYAW